ncbi:nicotinate phosphoribosyltransferase [Candidatus Poribacteria bacterium]|nr:nicotinate phosphoribosyltransferase [Candidatus Poribacteria bacterium]
MATKNPTHISALLTDLYELTMAASYFNEKMFAPATFSLFIRKYPKDWGYFINAGLEDVLTYLERFRFTKDEVVYLRTLGLFSSEFLDYLAAIRFTGDVRAMKEGDIFFVDEPLLEVTAPLIEAQLVETYIINAVHLQSLICTKASRSVMAARGKSLIDFSLRRTHGPDAGLKAARSSFIAGFQATSNVLAGQLYGIPVSGTMAHSYVTAFDGEIDAFRAFARAHPNNTIFLIDTYDTLSGARNAREVGLEMKEHGQTLLGVRLDSGDMAQLSKQVRRILDGAGLDRTKIFASSGFDEYKISGVFAQGAQIDGFGVGTNMGVSKDVPSTDMAYKLVEYDGRPVLKLSAEKATLPGGKQVFRIFNESGRMKQDTIALRDEKAIAGTAPLLTKVMEKGKSICHDTLGEARNRCSASLRALPDVVARVTNPERYLVLESNALEQQKIRVRKRAQKQIGAGEPITGDKGLKSPLPPFAKGGPSPSQGMILRKRSARGDSRRFPRSETRNPDPK